MSGDDFMCESAVFNGAHCKKQCKSCAPHRKTVRVSVLTPRSKIEFVAEAPSTLSVADFRKALEQAERPATIDQRVVLPRWLYDAAKKEGVDMKFYIRNELIPRTK
jgi:hypothetical protein